MYNVKIINPNDGGTFGTQIFINGTEIKKVVAIDVKIACFEKMPNLKLLFHGYGVKLEENNIIAGGFVFKRGDICELKIKNDIKNLYGSVSIKIKAILKFETIGDYNETR